MASRGLYFLPSGRELPVVICGKTIYLRANRVSADNWIQRQDLFDGWIVGVYAETETGLWLYTALAGGMWGKPTTGGLVQNLKRAGDASVVYEVQWPGLGLRVALCDKDPAMEGGLANLIKQEAQWRRGDIPMPPSVVRVREIWKCFPEVDAIMLPASPVESNAMRLALSRVLLIRPRALARIDEPEQASTLDSPARLLPKLVLHRAPDRMASLEDPPGRRLWTAPRLGYSLTRRRVAQVKDSLRRVLLEKPKESFSSMREFLAEMPKESLGELVTAIGYLVRSLLEGWAAVLVALAALIGALARIGLL
jgi:hypothetical protein